MSIKFKIANQIDAFMLGWVGKQNGTISLTPVFHVEKLYNDSYFSNLLDFCQGYTAQTGARAVLTCMTPHSPILARELSVTGCDPNAYWDRIAALKEHGIIGLHGHFVRGFIGSQPIPMHCSFYDMNKIKDQIIIEQDALHSRHLTDPDTLIYSGGWWFTVPSLGAFLASRGFRWDYSLSSSKFNRSPGSDALITSEDAGVIVQKFGDRVIKSAIAVSSIAKPSRPYHAATKIWAQRRTQGQGDITLSLYSHDYDLNVDPALRFVDRALATGVSFAEPA